MIDTLIYIADDKHLYSKEGYQAVTPRTNGNNLPILMLVSDDARLADPAPLLKQLPRGAFVLLRSKSEKKLKSLAGKIIPSAHKLGLGVLIAGPVRLAHALGADGAHLNEMTIKRHAMRDIWPGGGRRKEGTLRKGFILSASAHGRAGLMRARDACVDFVLLGHAFASQSHPDNKPLGVIRFCLLAKQSPVPVVAIGGLNKTTARARRLTLHWGSAGNNVVGMAGIGMFGGQK